MATHKSAEKRARQTLKRTMRNRVIISQMRTANRLVRETATQGNKDATAQALAKATRLLFKAASKGVLHKRAASRQVSRLTLAAQRAE